MTKRITLQILGLILLGIAIFSGCSKEDENNANPNNTALLFNKWWYEASGTLASIYFSSDGVYEQSIAFFEMEFTHSGDWEWENESAGILLISNVTGSTSIVPPYSFKISNIQEHSITVQTISTQGDYSQKYSYVDSPPEE